MPQGPDPWIEGSVVSPARKPKARPAAANKQRLQNFRERQKRIGTIRLELKLTREAYATLKKVASLAGETAGVYANSLLERQLRKTAIASGRRAERG